MFHKVAFFLQLSCLSLFNCLVISAATPSLDRAIEKSAELPALSQHLAKVYVSLCNNIKEPSFYQERDAVMQAFDENMHELGCFVPNDAIKAKIQKVRSIWQEYKTIANWTIHKEGASKLLKLSAEILEATNLLYQEYQNYAQEKRSIKTHKIEMRINAALQDNRNISILMYRIMLYYLAEKQGIDPTVSGHKLDEAQQIFNTVIRRLTTAKISSEKIQLHLQQIQQNWEAIRKHLVFVDKDQTYVAHMHQSAQMIERANRTIVSIYQQLKIKLSISDAINDATAQAMISQKIAKAYIAYKYHQNDLQRQSLVAHIKQFEQNQFYLWETAQNGAIQKALAEAGPAWISFRKLVQDSTKKATGHMHQVIEQSEILMHAYEKVTASIEGFANQLPAYRALSHQNGLKLASNKDIIYQIHVSSHLRIYSQRIALFFMLKVLDLEKENSLQQLDECVADFNPKFKELKVSQLNTLPMNKLLESCIVEWDWMSKACTLGGASDIEMMLQQSDILSKKLMKLTNMYEHRMNILFSKDATLQDTTE